jgi:hypothetical protein
MNSIITFLSCFICVQLFACRNKNREMASSPDNILNADSMKLKITVGTNFFTATLYNNATVTAFQSRLPMTINMSELNGNEKYFDLPNNLPANASNRSVIQTGDFYQSFSTSYSYTRLAGVDNPSGLAAALGSGTITVKFEVE